MRKQQLPGSLGTASPTSSAIESAVQGGHTIARPPPHHPGHAPLVQHLGMSPTARQHQRSRRGGTNGSSTTTTPSTSGPPYPPPSHSGAEAVRATGPTGSSGAPKSSFPGPFSPLKSGYGTWHHRLPKARKPTYLYDFPDGTPSSEDGDSAPEPSPGSSHGDQRGRGAHHYPRHRRGSLFDDLLEEAQNRRRGNNAGASAAGGTQQQQQQQQVVGAVPGSDSDSVGSDPELDLVLAQEAAKFTVAHQHRNVPSSAVPAAAAKYRAHPPAVHTDAALLQSSDLVAALVNTGSPHRRGGSGVGGGGGGDGTSTPTRGRGGGGGGGSGLLRDDEPVASVPLSRRARRREMVQRARRTGTHYASPGGRRHNASSSPSRRQQRGLYQNVSATASAQASVAKAARAGKRKLGRTMPVCVCGG